MRKIHGLRVLDREDIIQTCPSFYAEQPKHDVSEKYEFINSRDVALQLWDAGWMLTQATEQRSNQIKNRGFTKHLLRFAHKDFAYEAERTEIVIMNSHNRSAALRMLSGVHIFACLNGLISASREFDSFSIRHIGMSVEAQVEYALTNMAQEAEKIAARIKLWKELDIAPEMQHKFARAAHILVWGDKEHAPVDASRLLWPRRTEEESFSNYKLPTPNLWTTMNVIQENVMKGGLRGTTSSGARHRTRAIRAIDRGVSFNQTLWQMTEIMAGKLAA